MEYKHKVTAFEFLQRELNASEYESEDDEITQSWKTIATIMDRWYKYKTSMEINLTKEERSFLLKKVKQHQKSMNQQPRLSHSKVDMINELMDKLSKQ